MLINKLPAKPKNKKIVYLDNAATTKIDEKVKKAMGKFLGVEFGNASAIYSLGRRARFAIENARSLVAENLKTNSDSIVFTSGGTESNNLAIFGATKKYGKKGGHIITTKIEHHSVLEPIKNLEKQGFRVTYLNVDKTGRINLAELKKALNKDTFLVSIMYANNEVGSIEDIAEIGKILLKWKKQNGGVLPIFHTDACQAAGYLDLAVERLHTDLLTLNGSKIYGSKGSGVLYKRRGITIEPLLLGGAQEKGLRAGTENTATIVGIATALEIAQKNKEKENTKIAKLRDYFWEEIKKKIKNVKLNGPEFGENRLPNNLNVSFEGLLAENLVFYTDDYGIICSTGSACTSETEEISHVLEAIGLNKEENLGSVRFTLGKDTTKADIDYVMKFLPEIVENLREVKKLEG